jgi:apolipoprotein N-acyltransferase
VSVENAAQDGTISPKTALGLSLAGSVLLWASLPPLGWSPLAWLAPACWVWLVRVPKLPVAERFISSAYFKLWMAGLLFWCASLYWIWYACPPWTGIGWFVLSSYLAIYVPLFVGLSRVAVHRLQVPVWLAAPVVWAGLEFAQAHLFTGFNMASIAHSQYRWLGLIQIADLVGQYGVSFVIVMVAASLAALVPCGARRWQPWALAPAAAILAATLTYGHFRMTDGERTPGPTITLIQGSVDTEMKFTDGEQERVLQHYKDITRDALQAQPKTDLVVWPETMYRFGYFQVGDDVALPPGVDGSIEALKYNADQRRGKLQELVAEFGKRMLLGVDRVYFGPGMPESYNSTIMLTPEGKIGPHYDKMHPVLFGEYVPFARQFPVLYQLTPLGSGIESGTATPAFEVPMAHGGTAKLAANICYETVLSHVIRGPIAEMEARGESPDILMNLTNDGWFWGSSELDLHLICGVFRAVECRKPFLAAANTGFSAWIDANGQIIRQGKRRDTDWIVAGVELDSRRSPYLRWGDVFAGTCAGLCVGLAVIGWRKRKDEG